LEEKEKIRVEKKEEDPGEGSERNEEKSRYSGSRGTNNYRSMGSLSEESRLSERETEKIKNG